MAVQFADAFLDRQIQWEISFQQKLVNGWSPWSLDSDPGMKVPLAHLCTHAHKYELRSKPLFAYFGQNVVRVFQGKLLKLAGIDQHLSFTHFATFHLLDQNDKDTCALQQNTATKTDMRDVQGVKERKSKWAAAAHFIFFKSESASGFWFRAHVHLIRNVIIGWQTHKNLHRLSKYQHWCCPGWRIRNLENT